MRKLIMSLTTVASLSLAAVPILGLTQAANAGELSARVAYGDLDLSAPAQAKIFEARVQAASENLCRAKILSAEGRDMPYAACIVAAKREVDSQLPKAQRQALAYAAHAKVIEVAAK